MKVSELKALWKRIEPIDGWFLPPAAGMVALADEVQRQNNITGNVFEIGVHHGKSSSLFAALTRFPEETMAVCDLFDVQDGNVSQSGMGDRAVFQANMAKITPHADQISIYAYPSDKLTLNETTNRCRFFHVDGGHHFAEALGDLQLAAQATRAEGLIIIDDPFRIEWPEVTEAVFAFLRQPDCQWGPILLGFNKLALAHHDARAIYQLAFDDRARCAGYGMASPYVDKRVTLGGHPTRAFYIPNINRPTTLRSLAYTFYLHHLRTGGRLRQTVRRLTGK